MFYTYRYYDPSTGRWPSRDPIGERGGANLYGMVANDSVNRWDLLGLNTATWGAAAGYGVSGARAGSVAGPLGAAALGLGGIILGELKIISDQISDVSDTIDYIDDTNGETEDRTRENVELAKDRIRDAKARKNPHQKPGKKCNDPCKYLCFTLARLADIKMLREFLAKNPIPNDPFDHAGQLFEITQAVANASERAVDAKCKCEEVDHGY